MTALGYSWIEDVMSEVQHVETPHSWIWWSLLSALSAACGNNYFLRSLKGTLLYKPNVYIMLLGESGLGKGFGINLAKLLVQKADVTRVIAGRSSIQAIVSELSKQKSRPDGMPAIKDSRGFIVNGELSSAIIADVDGLSILTDLYDGHYNAEWDNLLKVSGKEKITDPYITALFGSSPALFYDSIPQVNIEGGYIGRNLIIYEEKRSQDIDLLDDDDSKIDDKLKDHLIPKYAQHLVTISKSKGRLIPNPDAKELFNTWRRQWRGQQKPDKTGFFNRVPDHVLKVAMLLCLSRYSSGGIITAVDIQDAITAVTNLVYANRMTTEGRGLDPSAGQSKVILDILIRAENNTITRKRMLTAGHGNFDSFALDKIMETLIDMGYVEKERHVAGAASDWIYTLAGEPLASYNKWKQQQSEVKK